MAGYPPASGYPPYGAPPAQPYGAPAAQPYGAPAAGPYGAPAGAPYAPVSSPYGAPALSAPYGAPSAPPAGGKPGKENKMQGGFPAAAPGYPGAAPQAYGGAPAAPGYPGAGPLPAFNPFSSLLPSQFPPGTDPNIVACFQAADQDGSGIIDDRELQLALSSYNQIFSIRTVHLLMYLFTGTNANKIGPKEFVSVFYSLQNWRAIFERFDRDRSGKIDSNELRDALFSLGFAVSPVVLDLLVSKFDKTKGIGRDNNKIMAIEYDNFIECCLTVKGLTEKFKEKDTTYTGTATFTYETFLLSVLPFLVA